MEIRNDKIISLYIHENIIHWEEYSLLDSLVLTFLPTKTKINYVVFLVVLTLSDSEMAIVRSEVSKFFRILSHPT